MSLDEMTLCWDDKNWSHLEKHLTDIKQIPLDTSRVIAPPTVVGQM